MRNEKRKRYYVRELNNLKKLVTEREARRTLGEYSNMKTADQIALERKQQKLEKEKAKNPEAVKEKNDVNMEEEKVVRVYDKSMKDQFGNYPAWMKRKQIKKMKRKNDHKKNKKSRK